MSRRGQSGRRTSFGRRVWFIESHTTTTTNTTTTTTTTTNNNNNTITITVTTTTFSSSSSGAEPPLIGGFGLLNDILPICSILDTG